MTLATAEGDKKYRVVGVGNDYLTAKLSTVYISQDKLKEDFHVTSDVLVMANRRPGADAATVQKSLEKVVKDFPAFKLYTAGSWRASRPRRSARRCSSSTASSRSSPRRRSWRC